MRQLEDRVAAAAHDHAEHRTGPGPGPRRTAFATMYSDVVFANLAELWHNLDTNQPLNRPPATDADNLMSARLTVACNNPGWPEQVREYQRDVAVDRIKYPMLGGAAANIGPCAFWPNERRERVRINDRGPANVLMVQFERDPGTPLAGAKKMRQAFGQRATIVTDPGGGHGVYPRSTNLCSKNAVTTFLLTGARPAKDLACTPNI
ncbi:alpha/beta hydrolase [Kribbella sp. NPDC051952]|uniref:alpha/beta hydrolase n=1 Tax=Kribbella sp. NPDC051952 TaxID=3154851 RepID=UPI003425943E